MTRDRRLRIGFDIDDTVTRAPDFFEFLTKILVEAGHEVYFLTFRTNREDVSEWLASSGYHFTDVIVCGEDKPSEGFATWKAHCVRDLRLDVYFEDMLSAANSAAQYTVVFVPVTPRLGELAYIDPETD